MIYRREGLIFTRLTDPHWSNPKVARVMPTHEGGSWGSFLELKDTEWARFIDEVSSDSVERALQGDCTPLMKEGLRDPRGCLKRAPLTKECADAKRCTSFKKSVCNSTSKDTPECFALSKDLPPSVRVLLSAWKEGYYVVREKINN